MIELATKILAQLFHVAQPFLHNTNELITRFYKIASKIRKN